MIGLDTNVLVRYIAQDDPTQSPRAERFIERECTANHPGFVSLVTLIEMVWVSETCYGTTRDEVAALLRRLLGTRQLLVQEAEIVWKALRNFEATKADFADCLVERLANAAGCAETVTFDKAAAKAGMRLLK